MKCVLWIRYSKSTPRLEQTVRERKIVSRAERSYSQSALKVSQIWELPCSRVLGRVPPSEVRGRDAGFSPWGSTF